MARRIGAPLLRLLVVWLATTRLTSNAFTTPRPRRSSGNASKVSRRYKESPEVEQITTESGVAPTTQHNFKKRPTIASLTTLDEIKYFLEEDDRVASIFVYAPFCKSCQKLMRHYDVLARDLADGIVARKKVTGRIRCAKIEFTPQTKSLIMETLQIAKVPTLQMYSGLNKVWENCGTTTTNELRSKLNEVDQMTYAELREYAEDQDDGILQGALEEIFFDDFTPDFLNDEW